MQARSSSLSNITAFVNNENGLLCTIFGSINTKTKKFNLSLFIQRKKSSVEFSPLDGLIIQSETRL